MRKIKVVTLRYLCFLLTCPWVCQQVFPKICNIRYFHKSVLSSLFFLPVNNKERKKYPREKKKKTSKTFSLKHGLLFLTQNSQDPNLQREYKVLLRLQAIILIISHLQHVLFSDMRCYTSCSLKFRLILFHLNSSQII